MADEMAAWRPKWGEKSGFWSIVPSSGNFGIH